MGNSFCGPPISKEEETHGYLTDNLFRQVTLIHAVLNNQHVLTPRIYRDQLVEPRVLRIALVEQVPRISRQDRRRPAAERTGGGQAAMDSKSSSKCTGLRVFTGRSSAMYPAVKLQAPRIGRRFDLHLWSSREQAIDWL